MPLCGRHRPDALAGLQERQRPGCRDVGIHIANVIIASTTDAATKSIYERDREQMIRSMAEACTTNAWSDAALKCYGKANSQADLKDCEKKYTPPKPRTRDDEPQTRGSGAGSGSAAPAAAGSAAPARAGAGSAAPRPPRERPGSNAAKGSGAGSAAPTPRAGAGSAAPRAGAGSGSAR